MARVGIMCNVRSLALGCKITGVMVTASHNQVADNGVKMIDPNGGMLDESWESIATELANLRHSEVPMFYKSLFAEHVNEERRVQVGRIMVGMDTRPHSKELLDLVMIGAEICGASVINLGIVTTPQLHYLVAKANLENTFVQRPERYINDVSSAFLRLHKLLGLKSLGKLIMDCSCGVGFHAASRMAEKIDSVLELKLVNGPEDGVLNQGVGAEFVQKKKVLPNGLEELLVDKQPIASVDGDCDRLVYSYVDGRGFQLMDGDKILCLFTTVFLQLIKETGLPCNFGVCQTAYANGASTDYLIKKLGVSPVCCKTGVKHLIAKAREFDLSIFFEANGHGTVRLGGNYESSLLTASKLCKDERALTAINILLTLPSLMCQEVGDALADILLVELCLAKLGWSCESWAGIYDDYPSRLTKVSVRDRFAFKTTNAERTCVEPKGIQSAIDKLTKQIPGSRGFVRPSGTEDCVRVFAEAPTQHAADRLNHMMEKVVVNACSV